MRKRLSAPSSRTANRRKSGLRLITDIYDAQAAYDLARNTTILQADILRLRYEVLEAIMASRTRKSTCSSMTSPSST